MSPQQIDGSWYVVQTRSQTEKCLTRDLAAKNIENYCPVIREARQWSDRVKTIERPVFPGYVFARFDDNGRSRLQVLQSTGAVRILGTAEKLEPVPDEEITAIRRVVENALSCYAHPLLREGSRVKVKRGVLKGVEGQLVRVKGQTRLLLAVELLGNGISTEVDIADVEPVAGNNS